MSYTVIAEHEGGPIATVTPSALDALMLARGLKLDDERSITIAAADGWILTLDELEALTKA